GVRPDRARAVRLPHPPVRPARPPGAVPRPAEGGVRLRRGVDRVRLAGRLTINTDEGGSAVIVISRGLARSFRALVRKCVSGRPRGPAPAVVLEGKAGTLTVWARTADATLVYAAPTPGGDELMVVPMAVLEAAEGGGDDPVELAVGPKLGGTARWAVRGVPMAHPFDVLLPGKQHRPPELPGDWQPAPAEFLAAL